MLPFEQNLNSFSHPASWELFRSRNLAHRIRRDGGVGRMDRQTAKAVDCLAHAIEYLEDTMPLTAEATARTIASGQAVELLKCLNRNLFVNSNREVWISKKGDLLG